MTTTGQEQDRWGDELAQIAWQIEQFKARADVEYHDLHTTVDSQFAVLQNELRKLEAKVAAAGENEYGRKVAAQVAELTAKGDAAYALVLASLQSHDDAAQITMERRQSEGEAPSGDGLGVKPEAQHMV